MQHRAPSRVVSAAPSRRLLLAGLGGLLATPVAARAIPSAAEEVWLAYEAQREDETDRLARRADAIRDRLGWEAGILNPDGWKPKGMHWRTFWRLKAEHDRLKGGALGAWAKRLGILDSTGR